MTPRNDDDDTDNLERDLRLAAATARPPRSIVGDVMDRLDAEPRPEWELAPRRAGRPRRLFLGVISAAAALIAIAATLTFFLLGSGASVTLADVKAALASKSWVHVRYDGGPILEEWRNPADGTTYIKRPDGSAVYVNDVTNRRLSYLKISGVISEDIPVVYPKGKSPPPFQPKTVWEDLVAPYEAAASDPKRRQDVEKHADAIGGRPATRLDVYGPDALGHRMLFRQLWVDDQTRLPVRERTRLQFGERPDAGGREWATSAYDFPPNGPRSLFDLGVPADTKVIRLEDRAIPADVRKVLDAARAARKAFPKNYRAIIWSEVPHHPDATIDVIYRHGVKARQVRYFEWDGIPPSVGRIARPISPAGILDWVRAQTPVTCALSLGDTDYEWTCPELLHTDRPVVHVTHDYGLDLVIVGAPEDFNWPFSRFGIGDRVQFLPQSDDTPPGCVGLRFGGDTGNFRHDYYVDPARAYVTVKQVTWNKTGGAWVRSDGYLNSDFRRFGNSWVPSKRAHISFRGVRHDEPRPVETWVIDIQAMTDADYPADTFNEKKLLEGAKVEPF